MWVHPNEIVAIRKLNGQQLAQKFPELKRDSFEEFVENLYDAGLELDFITANEMFEALKSI